jgi:hypothetical protein
MKSRALRGFFAFCSAWSLDFYSTFLTKPSLINQLLTISRSYGVIETASRTAIQSAGMKLTVVSRQIRNVPSYYDAKGAIFDD